MTDRNDPILDAFLREVLGSHKPPQLTDRILQAWAAQRSEPVAPPIQSPPVQSPPVVAPLIHAVPFPAAPTAAATSPTPYGAFSISPVGHVPAVPSPGEVVTRSSSTANRGSKHKSAYAFFATLAGLVVIALTVVAWNRGGITPTSIATHSATNKALEPAVVVSPVRKSPASPTKVPAPEGLGHGKGTQPNRSVEPQADFPKLAGTAAKSTPNTAVMNAANLPDVKASPATTVVSPGEVATSKKPISKSSESDVVSFINESLRTAWKEKGVLPSGEATDAEWCRRTYLRLIGRIPKVDELNRFVDDRSSGKRPALVDQLVNGSTYAEEYAANWASIFANVLIGRNGGTTDDARQAREGLQQFLRQAFHQNKPYDQLVSELITATGSNKPTEKDYNPAVHFLLANQNDKATLATTRVARVFLGSQLHCAQCHVHPTNDWNQDQFWQLNAFFRQMHVDRDKKTGVARLLNRSFAGEGGSQSDGEIYFEQNDGKLRVAYPVFIDGHAIAKSGDVGIVDRRQELAKLITQSDRLGLAAVNRLWAHFLGFGFTKPIDDISPQNSPSHPALLERLSHEFAGHGYDVKRLMKWMTMSEAFGLSSKISVENMVDMPDGGTLPLFTHYYTRQMQAEELFQSLQMLADARKTSPGDREKAKQAFLGRLTRSTGADEGDERQVFQNVPRSLMQVNGDGSHRGLLPNHEGMLAKVAESSLTPEAKIEHLFLAALSRKPTKRELASAQSLLATAGDESPLAGLQDLWWVLLNSNEFILDH